VIDMMFQVPNFGPRTTQAGAESPPLQRIGNCVVSVTEA